jgi:6-phosphogluconate dehydrogenase
MGENLALNLESHGHTVAVYNRTTSKVDSFVNGRAKGKMCFVFMYGFILTPIRPSGKKFVGTHSVDDLCKAVKKPRKILMMIQVCLARCRFSPVTNTITI